MIPAAFSYERPADLDEALGLMAEPGARALAGGQSLINVLKLRAARVESLVDISKLDALRFVKETEDGGLEIGACVTYEQLVSNDLVRLHHPRIAEIAGGTVDIQVRSRGTIGGNCCYADPSSNFPPLMVALDATMQIASRDGGRRVPARDFFRSFATTALGPGELLTSILVPGLGNDQGVGYSSLQIAKDSWSLARAAVLIRANGAIESARVILGCVTPMPLPQPEVDARLVGLAPGDARGLAGAAEIACEGVETITDVHASGDYRREMAKEMVRRAVREALEDIAGERRAHE